MPIARLRNAVPSSFDTLFLGNSPIVMTLYYSYPGALHRSLRAVLN